MANTFDNTTYYILAHCVWEELSGRLIKGTEYLYPRLVQDTTLPVWSSSIKHNTTLNEILYNYFPKDIVAVLQKKKTNKKNELNQSMVIPKAQWIDMLWYVPQFCCNAQTNDPVVLVDCTRTFSLCRYEVKSNRSHDTTYRHINSLYNYQLWTENDLTGFEDIYETCYPNRLSMTDFFFLHSPVDFKAMRRFLPRDEFDRILFESSRNTNRVQNFAFSLDVTSHRQTPISNPLILQTKQNTNTIESFKNFAANAMSSQTGRQIHTIEGAKTCCALHCKKSKLRYLLFALLTKARGKRVKEKH
ncbi:hypothetical protein RFI_26226 [Reticulomyxa filosa]|uniref:Uncharacterized protein n=1 Tax=Reticulomyxa filosa TaxID=46433 RepID=X6MBA9_RETFI|nr:hypothetical protein RFI_26226 [Reticulomyxa filosa]|eukprot:ETO11149.1 hypothetical protein RFI_26226 [Reticulomyxa filosa]